MKIGRRIMVPTYLDPPQVEALKRLSATTRVPVAVYVREAIDDLLAKYQQPKTKRSAKLRKED